MGRTIVVGLDNVTTNSLLSNQVLRWSFNHVVKPGDHILLVHGSKTLYNTSGTIHNNISDENLHEMISILEVTARQIVANYKEFKDNVSINVIIKVGDPRDTVINEILLGHYFKY
ncbi:hypothetical protein HK099_003307 [Clydaea vesicula]|uniref:Uncharacterized protein n=1 Tax=Clydaea vesicula TaxID=447962 RepID=A0AAD5U548_9FUNG|nr:hypothetical protein HK099_003307 [Clydaea vesicula]